MAQGSVSLRSLSAAVGDSEVVRLDLSCYGGKILTPNNDQCKFLPRHGSMNEEQQRTGKYVHLGQILPLPIDGAQAFAFPQNDQFPRIAISLP